MPRAIIGAANDCDVLSRPALPVGPGCGGRTMPGGPLTVTGGVTTGGWICDGNGGSDPVGGSATPGVPGSTGVPGGGVAVSGVIGTGVGVGVVLTSAGGVGVEVGVGVVFTTPGGVEVGVGVVFTTAGGVEVGTGVGVVFTTAGGVEVGVGFVFTTAGGVGVPLPWKVFVIVHVWDSSSTITTVPLASHAPENVAVYPVGAPVSVIVYVPASRLNDTPDVLAAFGEPPVSAPPRFAWIVKSPAVAVPPTTRLTTVKVSVQA